MTYFDVICSHFTVATFAVNVSCTRFMTVCYQHYSHTCTCLLRPISCSLTVYSHEAHWVLFTQYTNCVQWSMCFMQKNKKKQSETICSEEGLRKSSKCCPREAGPVYSSLSESSVDVSPLAMCTVCMCSASGLASASPSDLSTTTTHITSAFFVNENEKRSAIRSRERELKTIRRTRSE